MNESLKQIELTKHVYLIPRDNLVSDVIVPCLEACNAYDVMTGFFSSDSLKQIAPGLATLLQKAGAKVRLLVSPLVSPADQEALRTGISTPQDVIARTIEEQYGEITLSADALTRHTLTCLSYMIASTQLQMKVVIVRDGMFHPKIRIFRDGSDSLVAHGSSNMTTPGQSRNYEQITISRNWGDEYERAVSKELIDEFDLLWNRPAESDGDIRVFDLPTALSDRIVKDWLPTRAPTNDDYFAAAGQDSQSSKPNDQTIPQKFLIPTFLAYESGPFAHQNQAVKEWEKAGRSGILEMATGSGKTITALIAAQRLHEEMNRLLVIVAVPYIPLLYQWADAAQIFGLPSRSPTLSKDKHAKLASVQGTIRNLTLGITEAECLIVTHDFLTDPSFLALIDRHTGPTMLIADEVHHLGSGGFIAIQPQVFTYRLGLSATPMRQYDEAGTEALLDYFGPVIFEFTLAEAIGVCLVPYDYFVHPVELSDTEVSEWIELSEKLRRLGWLIGSRQSGSQELPANVQNLLLKRRRVLEQAEGKIAALQENLATVGRAHVRSTLVYASDKGRAQLEAVNRMLMDVLGLRIHQVTQQETGHPSLLRSVLDSFITPSGIQVLTAMRVLDEGIDIPEIVSAHIVASTTVERQWVQRRGRVLRLCPRIGKTFAEIHDYVVVPPQSAGGEGGDEVRGILSAELRRVLEFASLARNFGAPNGPLNAIEDLMPRFEI